MNVGAAVKLVSSAAGARGSYRDFKDARGEQDKLKMAQAAVSAVSIALAVAILIREMRENRAVTQSAYMTDPEDM